MIALIYALILITALFVLLVLVKFKSDIDLCAICAAVSGTWLLLLLLFYTGRYENQTVIALLMGQSIVGGFYLLKGRLPDRYNVFALPFVLSATVVAYLLLSPQPLFYSISFVILIWIVGMVLFAYRENSRVKSLFQEIIDCCRDW